MDVLARSLDAAGTLYQGMVVALVNDVQDGRRDYTVGELFRAVTPVLLPLIVAGFLAGIGIGIGLILLIIPGLILLTIAVFYAIGYALAKAIV